MADMLGFGAMDLSARGGKHSFSYENKASIRATSGLTPSQTIGPFFAFGLAPGHYRYPYEDVHKSSLAGEQLPGRPVQIAGQVFDGAGRPIHDALVEIVQADSSGNYAEAVRADGFTGYGRCGTGAHGPDSAGGDTRFLFHTIKPGTTQKGAAPFLTVIVAMRGLMNHCITRIYFPEDELDGDPVLRQVPETRRRTLVAQALGGGSFRFNIHMQGDAETVFFDL